MEILNTLKDQNLFREFALENFGKKVVTGKTRFVEDVLDKNHVLENLKTTNIPSKALTVKHTSGIPYDKKISPVFSGARAVDLINRGQATLIFTNFRSYFPSEKLQSFCQQLEKTSKCLIRSNLYHTISSKIGYPFHWDTHNLIVFQLEGKKKWEIYEPTIKNPVPFANYENLPRSYEEEFKLIHEVVLEEGDFLFMPKGFGHKVTTASESSLHVTFGFHDISFYDLFKISAKSCLNSMKMDITSREYLFKDQKNSGLTDNYFQKMDENLKKNIEFITNRNFQYNGQDYKYRSFSPDKPYAALLRGPNCYIIEDAPARTFHLFIGNPTQEGMNSVEFPDSFQDAVIKLFREGLLSHHDILMEGVDLNDLYMLESFGIISLENT